MGTPLEVGSVDENRGWRGRRKGSAGGLIQGDGRWFEKVGVLVEIGGVDGKENGIGMQR